MQTGTDNLINILTEQTEGFRVEYIHRITVWAGDEFARIEALSGRTYEYKSFATPGFVKDKNHWIDYAQGKAYRKAIDARDKARRIVEAGRDAYVTKIIAAANEHYSDSIAKLAGRIRAKGLDVDALIVKTAFVDVNLEIVLTDGSKTVRAFTIIASGPIQKPHYRYLIK